MNSSSKESSFWSESSVDVFSAKHFSLPRNLVLESDENDILPSLFYIYSPCVSATLSILGSGMILYIILRRRRHFGKAPRYRILLGMSAMDLIYSQGVVLGPLLLPSDSGVPGASGNDATCQIVGVTTQISLGTASYNAMLSLYYCLRIGFQVSDESFARFLETPLHATILLLVLTTCTMGVGLKAYNLEVAWCVISAYPTGCEDDESVECTRGAPSILFELWLYYLWLVLFFFVHLICHVIIFVQVRKQTRKMDGYVWTHIDTTSAATPAPESPSITLRTPSITSSSSIHGNNHQNHLSESSNRRLRAVATQSCLYLGAFLISWSGPLFMPFWPNSQTFMVFALLATPMQGFLNFLVFLRPTFVRERHGHPNQNFLRHLALAIQTEASPPASSGPRRRRRGPEVEMMNRFRASGISAFHANWNIESISSDETPSALYGTASQHQLSAMPEQPTEDDK